MSAELIKRIGAFIAISYSLALLLDTMSLYGLLPLIFWGFIRMWSVALAVMLCLILFEGKISRFRMFLNFPLRLLRLYLLSPLIVYAALGIYILMATSLNLFNFSTYIDLMKKNLAESLNAPVDEVTYLAQILAYAQIAMSYIAAITLNMLFALGEEIGWRGYLYTLLGSKPVFKTALIIGIIWGFWHTPAIILLGYNYQFNRLAGIPLFTTLAVLFTYPQLLLTDRARGSVLPSSAFHGAINAIWGLTAIATRLPADFGELMLGLGLTGILSWSTLDVILHLILVLAGKRRYEGQN